MAHFPRFSEHFLLFKFSIASLLIPHIKVSFTACGSGGETLRRGTWCSGRRIYAAGQNGFHGLGLLVRKTSDAGLFLHPGLPVKHQSQRKHLSVTGRRPRGKRGFQETYQASHFSPSSGRIRKCNHLSFTLKETSQESQVFTLTWHVLLEVFTDGEHKPHSRLTKAP